MNSPAPSHHPVRAEQNIDPLLATLGITARPWPQYPVGVIEATPAVAAALLARTPPKRLAVARPDLVARYVAQMRAGDWPYTGDTVKLNCFGDQIDGTHRLLAIVDAEWTGPLAIALNVPAEAAWAMDPPGTPATTRGLHQ